MANNRAANTIYRLCCSCTEGDTMSFAIQIQGQIYLWQGQKPKSIPIRILGASRHLDLDIFSES